MKPVLLGRRTTSGDLLMLVVYPDYVVNCFNSVSTILFTRIIDTDPNSYLFTRDIRVTTVDIAKLITETRYGFYAYAPNVLLNGIQTRLLANKCYINCRMAGFKWTVITGMDDLLHRLHDAISDELFFT
jgi:hypothetical protein